jgi:hypothetical protein
MRHKAVIAGDSGNPSSHDPIQSFMCLEIWSSLLPKTTLFRKGLNSYASLSSDDQAAFHAIMMGFQVNFARNSAYLREGIVSMSDYRGTEEDWVRILKCPEAREWWAWVKTISEYFQSAVVARLRPNLRGRNVG